MAPIKISNSGRHQCQGIGTAVLLSTTEILGTIKYYLVLVLAVCQKGSTTTILVLVTVASSTTVVLVLALEQETTMYYSVLVQYQHAGRKILNPSESIFFALFYLLCAPTSFNSHKATVKHRFVYFCLFLTRDAEFNQYRHQNPIGIHIFEISELEWELK